MGKSTEGLPQHRTVLAEYVGRDSGTSGRSHLDVERRIKLPDAQSLFGKYVGAIAHTDYFEAGDDVFVRLAIVAYLYVITHSTFRL